MTITTEYNIQDTIYYIKRYNNSASKISIKCGVVEKITIQTVSLSNETNIYYTLNNKQNPLSEDECFSSLQHVQKHLTEYFDDIVYSINKDKIDKDIDKDIDIGIDINIPYFKTQKEITNE